MFGFGRKKKVEDVCIVLKDHLIAVIRQVEDLGADSLLKIPSPEIHKSSKGEYTWWIASFQVFCTDSHRDGVKQIMLDGGNEYNGFQLFAYTDSTDTTTWKMQLKGGIHGEPTKNAKLMYETYSRIYGVQDIKGY